jgi:hypothetical protein
MAALAGLIIGAPTALGFPRRKSGNARNLIGDDAGRRESVFHHRGYRRIVLTFVGLAVPLLVAGVFLFWLSGSCGACLKGACSLALESPPVHFP